MKVKNSHFLIFLNTAFLLLILILLIDYFIVGSIIGISIIIVGSLGTWKKSRISIRILKLNIFLIMFFLLMNPAPQYWRNQFERRWMDNRTQLIEPNHPIMLELNSTFQLWFFSNRSYSFSEETDFENQVRTVDEYIRLIRFNYTFDQIQYNGFYDYLPTIDEILATEDQYDKWHDDCDGISILTASFLIYLGFKNTYISEVTYHFHTMVFRDGDDPKTADGYLNGISLYKGRVLALNDKQSYYLFNQTELFIPPARPLYKSIGEILTDGSVWKYEYLDLFSGYYTSLPLITNLFLMLGVAVLLGTGLVLYSHVGITKNLKGSFPRYTGIKMTLITGIFLFGMFMINYYLTLKSLVSTFDFSRFCNPILIMFFLGLLLWFNKKIKPC